MVEYKEIKTMGYIPIPELNKLGEDNWELVSVLEMHEGHIYLFKRKKENIGRSPDLSSILHYLSLLNKRVGPDSHSDKFKLIAKFPRHYLKLWSDGSGAIYATNPNSYECEHTEMFGFNNLEELQKIIKNAKNCS